METTKAEPNDKATPKPVHAIVKSTRAIQKPAQRPEDEESKVETTKVEPNDKAAPKLAIVTTTRPLDDRIPPPSTDVSTGNKIISTAEIPR